MASTHENYLHVISGGYNEKKRKEVRSIFQEATLEMNPVTPHGVEFYDLIVGALEEINAVGIKSFYLNDVSRVLQVFGVMKLLPNDGEYIEQAFFVMSLSKVSDKFAMPTVERLAGLRKQYCTEKRQVERTLHLSESALSK